MGVRDSCIRVCVACVLIRAVALAATGLWGFANKPPHCKPASMLEPGEVALAATGLWGFANKPPLGWASLFLVVALLFGSAVLLISTGVGFPLIAIVALPLMVVFTLFFFCPNFFSRPTGVYRTIVVGGGLDVYDV
ncbi:MAG: hypothetical protein HYU86_07260 [Chloroflexi bacterium]|nr:hypothetical protein [Chloroflexota bacterium]